MIYNFGGQNKLVDMVHIPNENLVYVQGVPSARAPELG